MSLQGKTALVTGGSRGIGRAVCLELAGQGADIALCYAGKEELALETAELCRKKGAKVLTFQCDVSNAQTVQSMMKDILNQWGRVDILVNNAGITWDGLMLTMKEEQFDKVVDTNLKGAFLCMKAAAHPMMKQRYGRVVNISSVVGLRGNPGQTNYAASKAGLIGLTKSAARELASRGITVNALAPGFIATDMTETLPENAKAALLASIPAARLGEAAEVARAVAFLVSEDAGYITGQVLAVDGGMSM